MSLITRMRDRVLRPFRLEHVYVTFRLQRYITYYLLPIVNRLAPGTNEAWMQLKTIRPFVINDRPLLAILEGDDVGINLEGPSYDCGGTTYSLGALVFVANAGWVTLGPIDASDLHEKVRKAIDDATFRWLSENGKLGLATVTRKHRCRAIEDRIALCQIAAAAGSRPTETRIDHV